MSAACRRRSWCRPREYGAWAEDAAGFGWTDHEGPASTGPAARRAGRGGRAGSNGIYRRCSTTPAARIFEARATLRRSAYARCRRQAGHRASASSSPPAATRCGRTIPGRRTRHHLRRRLLPEAACRDASPIVGTGYIAVEFAGIFHGLGAEVDLVYRSRPAAARLRPRHPRRARRRRWRRRASACIPAASPRGSRRTATHAC